MKKIKTLRQLFSVEGFVANNILEGQFGDHKARIITLRRQKKQRYALSVGKNIKAIMINELAKHVIAIQEATVFIFVMKDGASIAKNADVFLWKN